MGQTARREPVGAPTSLPECYRINLDYVQLLSRWSRAGHRRETSRAWFLGQEKEDQARKAGTSDSSERRTVCRVSSSIGSAAGFPKIL